MHSEYLSTVGTLALHVIRVRNGMWVIISMDFVHFSTGPRAGSIRVGQKGANFDFDYNAIDFFRG